MQARREFLKTGRPPIFTYPRASNFQPEPYLRALHQAKELISSSGADPILQNLYLKKCDENKIRAELVTAMAERDDQTVTRLSRELFGSSFDDRSTLEKELTEVTTKKLGNEPNKRPVDADRFELMVRRTLDHYDMTDWKITRRKTSSMRITHGESGRRPNIVLPKSRLMSAGKAVRLITHEIEVHALRMQNALNGPLHLLRRGLAGYVTTEEGLALYCQQHLSGHAWKRSPGFWDAYACALARETDFIETYRTLSEHRGPREAWRLCLRVYRGIHDTSKPGVGFFRDHIYRTGYGQIKKAIADDDQLFSKLFSGHFGLADLEELEALAIPPGRQPDFVADRIVKEIIG